ncbi:hypothetical protein OCU04_008987 [Sclerotinia nivalis]|uniref:Uncharacterized protein n=1 Tax=Sclerotinia nivalis TaxID=352851 RepID=A0A9X0AGL0_9HELO|nr:hypothetical protein OCU04_008987 [Sclerotinia nivalis]
MEAILMPSTETNPDIAENMNNKQNDGVLNVVNRKADSLDAGRPAIPEGETATFDTCHTEQPITSESHDAEKNQYSEYPSRGRNSYVQRLSIRIDHYVQRSSR